MIIKIMITQEKTDNDKYKNDSNDNNNNGL